jgi:PAT family beta-lactamase induction signal transducer AmpG
MGFISELMHFSLAVLVSVFIGKQLIQAGLVNRTMAHETWVEPIADFFLRYGVKTALLILLLIGLYRISDIVPGVISNLFYQDLGFTKPEIATAVKTFGVIVSIVGGFLGGLVATRYGVYRTLMIGAILTAFTNLVFVWLALVGRDISVMYTAVTIDNLAAGFASAAFVAFLSSLTSISFTAVQYAIFSSLMTLLPKTIGGYSGTIVDNIGYPGFFVFVTLIGIPVLWLVWKVTKNLEKDPPD